jgi:type III secretory pathway component EscV
LAGEADGRRLVEEDVTILLMRAAVEAVVLWTVGEAGRSLGVD